MKISVLMQKALDAKGIKKENLLYLTIAKSHLDRITNGTKKVEFREASPFYYSRLAKVVNGVEVLKPVTHILFQAGYNPSVPRTLVELKDWRAIFEIDENGKKIEQSTISEVGWFIRKEALKEGYKIGDEYLGIVLGDTIFKENYS